MSLFPPCLPSVLKCHTTAMTITHFSAHGKKIPARIMAHGGLPPDYVPARIRELTSPPIVFHQHFGLPKVSKRFGIEQLIPDATVERLDVRVLPRAARRDVQRVDPGLLEPVLDRCLERLRQLRPAKGYDSFVTSGSLRMPTRLTAGPCR